MSKTFTTTIKIISFLVGIGYFVFVILPLIGGMIFTIGLGMIGNKLSTPHLVLYASLILSIVIVYGLFKVYKSDDGKKTIYLFLSLLILISAFHISLKLWGQNERKSFESSKLQARQENEDFIKNHCVEIAKSTNSTSRPTYRCDDGSIR